MKVLCVTHFFSGHGGGIEIVAEQIARGLARRAVDVDWVALEISGETPASIAGVRMLPLTGSNILERVSGLPFPVPDHRGWRALRERVAACDLVHCHDGIYPACRAAAAAARRAGKPVVITQHIGEIPFSNSILRLAMNAANRFWTRPALASSDHAVFVSETVAEFFSDAVPAERRSVVPNGIDHGIFHPSDEPRAEVRRRLGLEPNRPMLLFVGRFVTKKGLDRLREAARALPHTQWVLVGGGPIDPQKWNAPNLRVQPPVSQTRLASWYAAADLLTLPSIGEGFPLVVQEAMACGTPCLVSEEIRSACPRVAPVLLSAGPAGRDFVGACREALANPGALEAMRSSVVEAARAWSWEECVQKYHSIFENLVVNRLRCSGQVSECRSAR